MSFMVLVFFMSLRYWRGPCSLSSSTLNVPHEKGWNAHAHPLPCVTACTSRPYVAFKSRAIKIPFKFAVGLDYSNWINVSMDYDTDVPGF